MGRVERGASSDPASLGRPDSDVETVSELTVYLLSHGATHYEVADMARSLRDQGSKYDSLSGWRGWGSGLDGMREAGFSGSGATLLLSVACRGRTPTRSSPFDLFSRHRSGRHDQGAPGNFNTGLRVSS
jgi:hypothetical protein